jgi:hypothetical protein
VKTPNLIVLSILIVTILTFSGCLIYQTVAYTVNLNPDGKSGTIVIEYRNIESSATEPQKQDADFSELLQYWRGDKYLLDRMDDGVYVKKRNLTLEGGILVWREKGIFSNVEKVNEGFSYEDSTRVTIGKDETVLATNGTAIVTKDSTQIVWPPHTRSFNVKLQQRDFSPTSHFAEQFRKIKHR